MRKIISLICLLLPSLACASTADEAPQLRSDAPDKHIVVKGDTLWDISAKFFKDPWKWQYIWGVNKDSIKDPHWIYPGNIIYLDRMSGTLRVGQPPGNGMSSERPVVRLSPKVRDVESELSAIPTIPAAAISAFLSRPLIIEKGELENAPTLIGAREGRLALGQGDTAFIKGLPSDKGTKWQLFRTGKDIVDPETKEVLGVEAIYLGKAEVLDFADVSRALIVESLFEISPGDRLVTSSGESLGNYFPHAPTSNFSARILSIYEGTPLAGQHTIITLNKGSRDGAEVGHVLALMRKGESIKYDKSEYSLPDDRYGLVLVFRVFEKLSYALVMQTRLPVQLLDRAQTP